MLVVKYIVLNMGFFLCLNCDASIPRKNKNIITRWSLFDEKWAPETQYIEKTKGEETKYKNTCWFVVETTALWHT